MCAGCVACALTDCNFDLRRPLLWLVNVYEQRVQVEGIRQNVVPDRVPPHAQVVQRNWVLALRRQLDRF